MAFLNCTGSRYKKLLEKGICVLDDLVNFDADGLAIERSSCNWSISAWMRLLIISPASLRTFSLWASVSTSSGSRKTWTWLASLMEALPSAREASEKVPTCTKKHYTKPLVNTFVTRAVVRVQWADSVASVKSSLFHPRQHLGIQYWMIHWSEWAHKHAEILGRQLSKAARWHASSLANI